MFPEVDITLAERLGILNWNRFEELLKWAAEPSRENLPQDTESHLTSTVTSTRVGHTLSTGNDNTTDTGLTEPSVAQSGLQFGLAKGTTQYEDLETIFTASTRLATLFRVPDIPPVRHDGSRICTICRKKLESAVDTRTAWKRHVYQDLAPYTCTMVSCPASGREMFSNRRVWVEHEFQQHLAERVWSCGSCSARLSTKEAFLQHIERHHPEYTILESQIAAKTSESMGWRMKPNVFCPLCKMKLDPLLHVYAKHVGRHLEQIALIALRIHNSDEALEDDDEFEVSQSSDSGIDEGITADAYYGEESMASRTQEIPQPTPTQSTSWRDVARPAPDQHPAVSSTRNFEHTSPGARNRDRGVPKQRKLALVGSRSVGKSDLVVRFVDNQFLESYYPTIENTFSKQMRVGKSTYDVEIVDTAGQDEYSILNSKHYIGIHGCIIVYSVKSASSFEMAQVICDKIRNHLGTDSVPTVIVGHHSETRPEERQVTWEDGHNLSLRLNCGWTEASSRNGDNVSKAFELLILEIEKLQSRAELVSQSGGDNCAVM
ncbi:GTP-binding protein [Rhypophila decipiens]|uniref:GTP-binding protein n=1 Tax=Rhypophila decipiens TaxID=261697 RepID=A0AAN6XYB0_9PEZI|nr:GTP-binding protein [Rhypophila decipiens]